MRSLILLLASFVALPGQACPEFRVSFEEGVRDEAATGRLVVYLIKDGTRVWNREPADAPFFSDPQPMAGMSVEGMKPADVVALHTNSADAQFPVALHELPAGRYKAQAVLDVNRDNSNWRREPGNLFSEVAEFEISGASPDPIVELSLSGVVPEFSVRPPPPPPLVSFVSFRSDILSAYWGRDMYLRAAVIFPLSFEQDQIAAFPAVYEVPGFGGDHTLALRRVQRLAQLKDDPDHAALRELHENAFWIVLDPEGPNGHHLFVDSVNNGPYGTALVTELMVALQSTYPLLAMPGARVLRGHSSGGWSTIWLALEHPATFGAAWSTAPDPVDFTSFQQANIYEDENIYVSSEGDEVTSYRVFTDDGGELGRMSVRQENLMEQVLGPGNSSSQQWDSWFAVFGPNRVSGNPAPLFDVETGEIDREVAESFRKFDIAERVRREPKRSARIFNERIRLICGDRDNYYLNEAVVKLDDAVRSAAESSGVRMTGPGSIRMVPGADHGTVLSSPEGASIPSEIVEHFRASGFF